MNEADWATLISDRIAAFSISAAESLSVRVGMKLPYGYEILEYADEPIGKTIEYETDLIVLESLPSGRLRPRLIIECKVNSVTTHDAITYSQKHRRTNRSIRTCDTASSLAIAGSTHCRVAFTDMVCTLTS